MRNRFDCKKENISKNKTCNQILNTQKNKFFCSNFYFRILGIILSCDGWLSFVIDNVSEIEFVDVSSFPSSSGEIVLGQAFCAACKIRIAVLERNLQGAIIRRSDLDIARLIVHEAAHLADNCENGEEPALKAERAFLLAHTVGDCR